MRDLIDPTEFKLSQEHEELLDLYLVKLKNHLKMLKEQDQTAINVQSDYLKRMLSEKE